LWLIVFVYIICAVNLPDTDSLTMSFKEPEIGNSRRFKREWADGVPPANPNCRSGFGSQPAAPVTVVLSRTEIILLGQRHPICLGDSTPGRPGELNDAPARSVTSGGGSVVVMSCCRTDFSSSRFHQFE